MTDSSVEQKANREANGLPPSFSAVHTLDLLSTSAKLLFAHGQTTEKTIEAVTRLARVLGVQARLIPQWGDLTLLIKEPGETLQEVVLVSPVSVDMGQVAAAMNVIDDMCSGRIDITRGRAILEGISQLPAVSTARFALLAAAGAAALGVIFGEAHFINLLLSAGSAGAGACLRRGLGTISSNLFVQPFCAALLAGVVGAIAGQFRADSALRLIAVCPCMVLVPGPHILNGAFDLARARLPLGICRLTYATLIVITICAGLLIGLSSGGEVLPASATSDVVPLFYDTIAAGVAVAAYGTFFSMPWKMLPIPILIGMLAHATRWVLISKAGASLETGALIACLIVGILVTPIANKLRLPFAAFAFASVVSLIPGVFLFRMAGGLIGLAGIEGKPSPDLLLGTIADGTTAILISLAMTSGLILPKMCIEHFSNSSR